MELYSSVAAICGLSLQKIPFSTNPGDPCSLSFEATIEPGNFPLSEVPNEVCDRLSCSAGLFARFMAEVARALTSIHDSGLFHGTVRPHTIVIDGTPAIRCFVDFENARWGFGASGMHHLKHDAFDLGNTFVWFLCRIAFGRSFADRFRDVADVRPFPCLLRESIGQLASRWSRQFCFCVGQVVSGLIEADVRNRVPVFAVPELIRHCAQLNPFGREYAVKSGLMEDADKMFFATDVCKPLVRCIVDRRISGTRQSQLPAAAAAAAQVLVFPDRTPASPPPPAIATLTFLQGLDPETKLLFKKMGSVLTNVSKDGFRNLFQTYLLSMIFFVRWGPPARVRRGEGGRKREREREKVARGQCGQGGQGGRTEDIPPRTFVRIVQMSLFALTMDRIPLRNTEDPNVLRLVRDLVGELVSDRPSHFVSSCMQTRHSIVSELAFQDTKFCEIYGEPHMASTYFLSVCVCA